MIQFVKFTVWLLYESSSSVFLYSLNEPRHLAGQGTRGGVSGDGTRAVELLRAGPGERDPVLHEDFGAALSLAVSSFQRPGLRAAVSGALGAGHGGEVAGILRRAELTECEADGPGWGLRGACAGRDAADRLMEPGARHF